MTTFLWIVAGGILMSAIALIGSVTLLLEDSTLRRILLPLVAFAAGTLLGSAFLHVIPVSLDNSHSQLSVFVWILVGFSTFFVIEQFLHWHHCHRATAECKQPLTYLILVGDGLRGRGRAAAHHPAAGFRSWCIVTVGIGGGAILRVARVLITNQGPDA